MQCADLTELLLDDERERDPEVERHVSTCARCTHLAGGLRRLDAVLTTSLVVTPPLELQQQLARLAVQAGRQPSVPWWSRASAAIGGFNPADWLARPQVVAAQGLAAVMLALASWQLFGWLSTFQPVVGDVAYAIELVAASPAVVYLGGLQLDVQNLGLWLMVGVCGWLISEEGLIGRRLPGLPGQQQVP